MMLDEEELKAIQTQKVKRSMSIGMDEADDSADEGIFFDNLSNTFDIFICSIRYIKYGT